MKLGRWCLVLVFVCAGTIACSAETEVPSLKVSPKEIGILMPSGPLRRTITITPAGTNIFRVLGVVTPEPGIQVTITPAEKGSIQIRLDQIPSVMRLDGKEVEIQTSDPAMPTIKIPFRVTRDG